ncbi:MAG: DUF4190 domain-containing protein [Pyrinomonadaceae bacterium]|nr:DUF4190 domain-containing protein [Pyrinomonadaceae bacterium]MBP6213515.1 DUF4190 domain-containing protein [Pyrinomonadaceae bacterium]
MKQCPRCNQSYVDDQLNFCLNDGELLMQLVDEPARRPYDDSPPTIVMNDPRATNPTNWAQPAPPVMWQDQSNMQVPQYNAPAFVQSRDQTLPTISLVLGILGFLMICCYGGIWLGLPAAIVGFMGMKNADGDPSRYGGRGLAIGGMVLGVISFLASFVFIILGILAS